MTVDIDVNLFVDPARYPDVVDVLRRIGVTRAPPQNTVREEGQGRLWWGRNPIDLFFAYHPVHAAMQAGARTVPFGDDEIPILSPEHLMVAKVVFNRRKDWLDIEQMLLATPGLDLEEAYRWLAELLSSDDERIAHLRRVVTEVLGED